MKNCPKCGVEHLKPGIFCSHSCANSRGVRTQSVKDSISNKLSGRKQTEERKTKTSGSLNGSWKGGVTKGSIICSFCGKEHFTIHRKVKFCSQECWKIFCASTKTEKQIYRKKCEFTFNVYDYPEKFDLKLVDTHGFYKAANRGNNQKGVQRDHLYSVSDGFKNKIDPFLISHPANCDLKFDFDNQRKRSKSSITIEELKERIQNW